MRIAVIWCVLSAFLMGNGFIDASLTNDQKVHQKYLLLEDSTQSLDFKEVLTDEVQKKFSLLGNRSAGFGLSRSDFWIKASFQNPKGYPIRRLLVFDYPLLDRVSLYRSTGDGRYTSQVSGDSVVIAEHEKKDEQIVFTLDMEPHTKETLYFHIRSQSTMDLRLSLFDEEHYNRLEMTKMSLFGIFYGGAAMMILYNFFLFLSIRESNYLCYVIFQAVNVLTLMALSGLAFRYFWPSHPDLNNLIIPFLIVLTLSLAIIFTRSFLDTATMLPKQDRILRGILAFALAASVLTLFLDYHRGIFLSVVVLFATTLTLVSVGLIAYFRYRLRASKFYLIAWILLLIGTTLTGLKNVGLLPINFFTMWGTQIGVFFELLLLSLALADRINVIRMEKERLQEEAAQKAGALTEVLRRSQEELVEKVKERTAELHRANRELHKNISLKEILLKEVHHRVKNNLQVIISMMWLQKRRTHNEDIHTLIDDITARLQSMAVIHEMLYQREDISMVNIEVYLHSLVDLYRRNNFEESTQIVGMYEPFEITMDSAVTMGLICNEVLSNVFKHAFKNHRTFNRLIIKCDRKNNRVRLRIKDNGTGFEGFVQNKKCIGVMLVHSLAEKLPDAQIVYKKWCGTYFKLEFLDESSFFNR